MVFGFGTNPSSSSSASTSSTSSTSTPASSPSDPANTKPAPNREQRAQCWTTRDAYFSCLDKNRFIQAGDERKSQKQGQEKGEEGQVGKGLCAVERGEYEMNCGKSWVDYFNKRRILEFRQKATLDAASKQGLQGLPGR
ncbi:MAG: hypothetical protein TREMPRED_002145 [Tremellales sp. Tagirdzhanova-0007]|nr:MAG: hypothetical protein TREMPRED_002145 [Tremellales sp. Tagirdzhanova-0007]